MSLKVYWWGYGGTSSLAEELRSIINKLDMEFITISEWDNANVKWDRFTWINELKKADIIVIPLNYKIQDAKSNNRLTQAFSLGKPVIASPLPAYLRIAEKYPNCVLFAETQEEWEKHLIQLRDYEQLRKTMSTIALEASKDFSPDFIVKQWIDLFQDLEKTDIIIPTYNNLSCLKLCIESIKKCTDSLYNLIIINNGTSLEVDEYLNSRADIIHIKKERLSFAKAINIGLSVSKSKYVCICNDDIIVSNNWLKSMISVCSKDIGTVGPLSNCDKGWLHNIDIRIPDNSGKLIDLLPGVNRIGEIEPIKESIYSYVSQRDDVLERSNIAFYCTLISREVIQKVGILDEQFQNSGEDFDYCYRITKMGYKIIQTYKSFVFHFGAIGRKILESENKEKYQEEQKNTNIYLNEKWNKKTVVIYSGQSWEKWNYDSINSGGIGGSETHQIRLSEELTKLNYRVISFADTNKEGLFNGVNWQHFSKFTEFVDYNYIDYFISERTVDPFKFNIRAGKAFVQIHDVWLLSGRNVLYQDKIDKFCVLSDWHRDFASDYHKISKDKFLITSNGIDLNRYEQKIERNPYRLIYSSSLDRGLDTLLYLFDFIKAEIPELELHIFYGFETWEKCRPDQKDQIDAIKKMMDKSGVFYHGRISQQELAQEQLKSSLWLYPTNFEETYAITAIECQAAGLPVITSNYAGLQTTIGDSGILIGNGTKNQSLTRECRIEFATKTIELLKNKELWTKWSNKGLENAKNKTWINCAVKWKEIFETYF